MNTASTGAAFVFIRRHLGKFCHMVRNVREKLEKTAKSQDV
jgi:hypothetical protein